MEQKITNLLDIIERAIQWIKSTESMQGVKGANARRHLVNQRRSLNKKRYALESNPAAAMYGESQMGKSYLAGSLLSESGKPFMVMDGEGRSYDFINQINPIGRGAESTSLITRFTSDYAWVDPAFPVKARLLSPADIVLVLCDSYYHDVKSKIELSLLSDRINDKVERLLDQCRGRKEEQRLILEDDIMDLEDYFRKHFSVKAANVLQSNFFRDVPAAIAQTGPEEWPELFSLLWNDNPHITRLYRELIGQFGRIHFSQEIYLPIKSILRDHGTLLDVARLHEIYGEYQGTEPAYESRTTLLVVHANGSRETLEISKSHLCALTAELVFRIPAELSKEKEFLSQMDLLDFPGARGRLGIHEEDVEDIVMPKMLLRGKVAYLFNKYSHAEKINILLFCHSDRMSAQSVMPEILDNWIGDMIGRTPEAREAFIRKSSVSPLFVISTMFNLDLQFDFNNDRKDNRNYMDSRWEKRFLKVLKKEIFSTETYTWFQQWTVSQPWFRNIFLLRDFYYSSETNSKLFSGYNAHKLEVEEILPESYPDFRQDLRRSFIEYEFVQQHFADPEASWDRAASMNEDGTRLIIEKLSLGARHIHTARVDKTRQEIEALAEGIQTELKKHFHDSDSDALLQKAKEKAGRIQAHMALAFGKDRYFFGSLMQDLMLSNSDVYKVYLQNIRDIERRDVKNVDQYAGYRSQMPDLDPNDSFENNLERVRRRFEMSSVKECQAFFEGQGIDLHELFYGNSERVKNFSQVLAEALGQHWFETHLAERHADLAARFSEEGWQDMKEMLRSLYDKLELSRKIAGQIRHYVDGNRDMEDVYEMIADLSVETLNKFIHTVGMEFLSGPELEDLRQANGHNDLGLKLDHRELEHEGSSREEAAQLVSMISNLDKVLNQYPIPLEAKRLPHHKHYLVWSDHLKVGFVSVCDIPNYDVQANNQLRGILDRFPTTSN